MIVPNDCTSDNLMNEIVKRLGSKDKIISELLNVYKKENTVEIKNDFKQLVQKYAINVRLNKFGIQRAKKLIEKYWEGQRLPDDEFVIAASIIPMYYYGELRQIGAIEIIKAIYLEAEQRFGINWQDYINPKTIKQYHFDNPLSEAKYLFLLGWSIKEKETDK